MAVPGHSGRLLRALCHRPVTRQIQRCVYSTSGVRFESSEEPVELSESLRIRKYMKSDRDTKRSLAKHIAVVPDDKGDAPPVAALSLHNVKLHEFGIEPDGMIAVVEMGDPKKANCLSSQTLQSLEQTFLSLSMKTNLRAVILTGCKVSGIPLFSAGANINEMEAIKSYQEAEAFIHAVFTCCEAVRKCPVPTIARIEGLCFGAAMEIAACCDFRYGIDESKFSMKEVALGIPSVIQARMLANIVGWQETKKMVLLGSDYSSQEMQRVGFLDGCYQGALPLDRQIDQIINIIAKNGPKATRAQKELNIFWEEKNLRTGLWKGIGTFAHMWDDGGSEPKQYMGAWLARRQTKEVQTESEPGEVEGEAAWHFPKIWNYLESRS